MVSFKLENNTFDSGTLADKVGTVTIENWNGMRESDGFQIADLARREGYQLITLKSERPVKLAGFAPMGTIAEYEGSARVIRDILRPVLRHYAVSNVQPSEWISIEHLLQYAAPTRFSKDSRLTPVQVRKHKIQMLRFYYEKSPQFCVMALSSKHVPVGFQSSYLEDHAFVLYELAVDPKFHRGTIAAELLSHNIDNLRETSPDINRVVTRIYVDNETSTAFFQKIGLSPTERKYYHYHLWT